jgi:hypothetical protein
MKYICLFLTFFSFAAIGKQSVVDQTTMMLNSKDPSKSLDVYYQPNKVQLFREVILENGAISHFECEQNHNSKLFDTVACYVSYKNLPSGVVWEFYYFLDEGKWIGTNLGIISVIPIDDCVANVEFKNALGQGITYQKVSCDKPHG